MNQSSRKFPATAHVYLWAALVTWCGLPFWIPAIENLRGTGDIDLVYVGALACFAFLVSMRFVASKCSSESLSFLDGMLYIACYAQTGWMYTSLLTVFVAVPFALAATVGIVVRGLLVGAAVESYQQSFQRLVRFFHRNRMVQ